MSSEPLPSQSLFSDVPEAPPASLHTAYSRLSHRYVGWWMLLMVWAAFLVFYQAYIHKYFEMYLSLVQAILGGMMAMLPTFLFGGRTWYKRLAWMTLLLGLFLLVLIYPTYEVFKGVVQRFRADRYHADMYLTDVFHSVLAGLTILLYAWTIWLLTKAARITRRLARGDYSI